jgi:hypothetical protein
MGLLSAGPQDLEAGWENYADGTTPTNDPSNFTQRVYAGITDAISSDVELYWDYVQGANKATQFCLTITGGNATHTFRVPAVATAGTQKHRVDIKLMHKDVSVSITIAAEFVAASGVIRKTAVSGWSFTPNTSAGSSPTATLVGVLDWAGANTWVGTSQYRTTGVPTADPSNFSQRIYAGTPDSLSSNVELYFDYAQNTNRASQFALSITDGTATYVYRVPAVGAYGTQTHRIDLKRLKSSKAITITITAEYSGEYGIARRSPVSGWSFTPSSSSGSTITPATNVGTLDWAGGNVWFDTKQYRNNIAPTNAPSAGFTLSGAYYESANQVKFTCSGLAYTQGANIATHIAVLMRAGGGSISLTTDAIVTLLNLATLPASYVIPYPGNAGDDYTVGVAAVALTKDGYSFNSTVREYSVSAVATNLQIVSTDRHVLIGAGTGKEIRLSSLLRCNEDVHITSGKVIKNNNIQVLGAQGAAIANPTDAASTMARLIDALGAMRTHGFIAT